MWDGISKWEIISPDYPDQNNGIKLSNYCIVISPVQESPHPWRQTEKSAKPEQDGAKPEQDGAKPEQDGAKPEQDGAKRNRQ
ncbi:hypothetical protein TNCV_4232541 [Trichonephila clavipes]|nr:hypothetical protein TNCV_4232541 [Trichonephila clavipes]